MSRITTGTVFEDSASFTREQVIKFAEITGDVNPIHVNDEFASKSNYGRIIVHGTLAGSAFSRILSTVYPGPGSIVIQRESLFIRPVFTDQPYKIVIRVSAIDDETETIEMKCYLKNSNGKNCIMVTTKMKNERIFSKPTDQH